MGSATFEDVLDRLYFTAIDQKDKGSKFERLIKRYLELEPKYADQFSDVWMWQEYPGRDGKVDTGIDLVAKDRYTGELTAIQCKFYDPMSTLQKAQIDSFFTAAGKIDFSYGMVISTTDKWSKHAEDALEGQSKEMTRLRLQDLAESTIDWAEFDVDVPEQMTQLDRKEPRKYQREAINDVAAGFQTGDRGKLIMACGTGKTYTSLKIVEEQVPIGGTVLFLVPSIALLQQTLNEWTAQATVPIRALAVCSDSKVGRKENEDVSVHDLAFPATTDPVKLVNRARISTGQEAVTVVFSTYQSIDVIAQAQQQGLADFDLILCDEAHRTTGITEADHDDSTFVRVHDETYLKAAKRLYMTATPRIYVQESKAKAAEDNVAVYSMDDESVFGPEFHHLGFGKAVEMGHLADYKVLVLAVDEEAVSRSFQGMFEENGDLKLDDVARIVGCWNGLSKRGVNGQRLDIVDGSPMRRAVAFARNIKESKKLAEEFELIGKQLLVNAADEDVADALKLEAGHVDGTFNVLERSAKLDWLKEQADGNVCRILSNVKCLSEGVDVPSLDAVLFLNPRNSQVDVVQSVGRVMRKSEGKEYGYIILPIAVPASQDPETALNDNKKYKVVWDVLQALRAHDDRFDAMINKLDLNRNANDVIDVIAVSGTFDGNDGGAPAGEKNATDAAGTQETLFTLARADEWRNAIFARMVRKVGDRRYWESWATDVKEIADRHVIRIRTILDGPDPRAREEFTVFLDGLRGNLNDGISESDAIDMLSQHLITKPVFEALFEGYSFAAHNPVSLVMDSMIDVLEQYNLDSEVQNLEDFYRSVRIRAEGVTNAEGKQKIITELYERFFKLAFPRTAESLGIVYTPVEVVDFIIRSMDDVLAKDFNSSLSAPGVHVLDPFAGTGTFTVRMLQSGRIKPEDLLRKYTQELHANEILLMAYYIAAINIEATLHGLLEGQTAASAGDNSAAAYVPFEGIVLTDTFQMSEDEDTLDEQVFTANNDRVITQNKLDIRVIVGNPPYSAKQTSENDNNRNMSYPRLDARIRSQYSQRSIARNRNSLYDPYIRAICWATDRVGATGVIGFVTNSGFLDAANCDGLRRTLVEEFNHIYIYNLRGNQKAQDWRAEGEKIFGEGSQTGAAITIFVKDGSRSACKISYFEVPDNSTRVEKLRVLNEANLQEVEWIELTPDEHNDWLNKRSRNILGSPLALAKDSPQQDIPIFSRASRALGTSRDAWVYGYSKKNVSENVKLTLETYDLDREAARRSGDVSNYIASDQLDRDPTRISWTLSLKNRLAANKTIDFEEDDLRIAAYRPFSKQWIYFNPDLNHERSKLPEFFPASDSDALGFVITGPRSARPFTALMVSNPPDLASFGGQTNAQFFSRYGHSASVGQDDLFSSQGPSRFDNVTDAALASYRSAYGVETSKDDVFFYVYGLLHSPDYRSEFAADLKKMLPRIPKVAGAEKFLAFSQAGRELSALHIGYEQQEPYPLTEVETAVVPVGDDYTKYAVKKMKYGGKAGAWDKTRIVYNSNVTLEGVPTESQRYMLGSRSGIDWILERYQVKTDKPSGIVNDPNDWSREHEQPRYIVDLIGRIVTVSLETNRIVDGLPSLNLEG
ncbi:type ISP restriction/modification enzyme [Specibacter sp. NPDC078709]|uniref:DEAD/DEAH box helicase n=1 Tax=Specibacter sp. NPDC078709 TaxID=3154364 RepID=UPI003434D5F4